MEKKLFDRKNTSMLHGIAILMMLYHHLFITGNTWCIEKGTSIFDLVNFLNIGKALTAQMTVAWFCKICVAVFAFTSGYGMFIQLEKKDDGTYLTMYRYCLKRLWSFYKKFVLCFLFFTVYEIIIGNPYEFDFSPFSYILNLLGLRSSYNATWWYISVYYCMILVSPLIYSFLKGRIPKKFVIGVILLGVLGVCAILGYAFVIHDLIHYLKIFSNLLQSALSVYLIIFAEGMLCARFDVLEKLASKLNLLTALLLLLITFLVRALLIRIPGDSVFDVLLIVPFVVSVSRILVGSKCLKEGLTFIGKYSAEMWYCHPYFYAYLFFTAVMRSDISFLVYLQVCLYSFVAAFLFDRIEGLLDRLFGTLRKNTLRKNDYNRRR